MTNQTSPLNSLEELATKCHEESTNRERLEVSACFELFRMAFDQSDETAWSIILQTYQRLIYSWVRKVVPTLKDDDLFEEISQGGVIRFWHSVGAKCPKLTDNFPHIGAILKYLKQSVTSSGLDYSRKQQREDRLSEKVERVAFTALKLNPNAQTDPLEEDSQLSVLVTWLETAVTDPKEQLLIKLMYEYDLKPREIAQSFPKEFPETKEVYRIKERLLKRARYALLPK